MKKTWIGATHYYDYLYRHEGIKSALLWAIISYGIIGFPIIGFSIWFINGLSPNFNPPGTPLPHMEWLILVGCVIGFVLDQVAKRLWSYDEIKKGIRAERGEVEC